LGLSKLFYLIASPLMIFNSARLF